MRPHQTIDAVGIPSGHHGAQHLPVWPVESRHHSPAPVRAHAAPFTAEWTIAKNLDCEIVAGFKLMFSNGDRMAEDGCV